MAKLLKLRRGTTSQHNTFTGAEGEVTIDTTKDTAVVHDGSQAGGRPLAREDMSNVSSSSIAGRLGADSIAVTKIAGGTLPSDVKVNSANITDGSIVNADINASAAIAGTKISPNFGSQDISTTGDIRANSASSTIGIGNVSGDNYVEIQQETQSTSVRGFNNQHGCASVFENKQGTTEEYIVLGDTSHDSNSSLMGVGTTDGSTYYNRLNLSGTGNLDITGNLTLGGTVDGRNVANDGTKLDGIESGATADQTAAEIRTLVESASNSNVFTDADHSKLNGIESGATADQTKSDIDGLNINADQVDGLHASSFLRSDASDTATGTLTVRDVKLSAGYHLQRSDHHSGHLEGSYNNVGANSQKTNPIYTIGSNYNPNDAALNNMYGVGYTHGDASFAPSNAGWGFYVAADGDRRLYLDGSNGRLYLGDQSTRYLTDISGQYGSVQVNGSGAASWEGYSIDGRAVFMHDGGTSTGIYNDVDNEWLFYAVHNGSSYMYHNNSNKIEATSGGAQINGSLTATGNVTAYSDARLKTNVNTINDALSIVGKLRGVSFDWKESGKHSIGLIAQEVEEVLPELVLDATATDPQTREETTVKTVDYGKIVGVLINAINELKEEVEELKNAKITG